MSSPSAAALKYRHREITRTNFCTRVNIYSSSSTAPLLFACGNVSITGRLLSPSLMWSRPTAYAPNTIGGLRRYLSSSLCTFVMYSFDAATSFQMHHAIVLHDHGFKYMILVENLPFALPFYPHLARSPPPFPSLESTGVSHFSVGERSSLHSIKSNAHANPQWRLHIVICKLLLRITCSRHSQWTIIGFLTWNSVLITPNLCVDMVNYRQLKIPRKYPQNIVWDYSSDCTPYDLECKG